MTHVDGQIIIHRPVDEVFDFVADERNEPRYNPQMRRLNRPRLDRLASGPHSVQRACHGADRWMMTITFTEYQRPRRLTSATHLSTMDIQGTLTFDPVPEGTRMRWSWNLKPRGMLKLMTPVIALIGRRQERTIWTGLKRYLEAREAPLAADQAVTPS